jgi:gliding-associated putative ABC transporter substrate-binding component GldG
MRNALVVAWKEFRTFFQTPVGYVILFVFTLLGGWFFFSIGAGQPFFIQKEASLRGLLTWLPWLFLVFAPAVTMRMWAEERRTGTIETLLTLPLTDWQIVIGKYLASFGLVAVWLLCLSPIAGVVAWFGEPDPGPVLGGFIGALLLGGAFASIGIAASALTENQIIALVAGVASAFFFLLVGFDPVVGLFPDMVGGFLYNLSLSTHFQSISRGVIDSRDVLYYASFIAFFLAINAWAVRRERGRGVTVALLAGILLFANYLSSHWFRRIDLTENGRYTLAADTKRILGKLDDDLRLTAYLSSELPPEFTNLRRDIEDLAREFESYAGGHLRVEIVDPNKNDTTLKAAEAAGITKISFQAADQSKLEVREGYLGMVIEFGDKTEKLPGITGVSTLEYDLVRRIAKMTRRDAVKVAWQVNDPFGGMEVPGMPRPPASDRHSPSADLREMDQALKAEYETTTVDLKSKIPDEVKAILLCNADTLTEVQRFHLDQFLMRGGGVVVMADGTQPMSFGGMGPRGGGSPFMRTASEKLPEDFFSHYGFKINKDLVLDLSCLPVPVQVPGTPFQVLRAYPAAPVAISQFIDSSHPVSARFKDLAFLWPASIELDPKPGVKAFTLVKTTDRAKKLEGFIDVSFQRMQDENSDTFDPETFKEQFLLAGMLEGSFQSYFVAHEVPKEVVEAETKSSESKADEEKGEAATPLGGILETEGDGTVHAKEQPAEGTSEEKAKPEGPPEGTEPDDGGGEAQGGGPRADAQDVPGGGLVRIQEPEAPKQEAPASETQAPAAAQAEPEPAEPGSLAAPAESGAPAADAAPKPEFEYLKQSTGPGRIFVIGTSEFVVDDLVGGQLRNDLFLSSIVDYMAAESLSTLRAKRIDEGLFQDPSDLAKAMARALGWFATPVVLLGLGLFVYIWRRNIRPARARRRMAAAAN